MGVTAMVAAIGVGCGRGQGCPSSASPPPAASPAQTSHGAAPPTARGGGPPIATPLAAQAAVAVSAAVDRLADASCTTERRCGRLGMGRQFAEEATCRSAVATRTRARVNATVCETGFLDETALRECESAIREAACDDASDPYETTCRPETLCAP